MPSLKHLSGPSGHCRPPVFHLQSTRPSRYIQALLSFLRGGWPSLCLHPAPHLPPPALPPPHCLPHPSEVNSSETFLGSNFHFLLRPLRRPSSALSGSVQQGRQPTLACNSRGDRGGGDSWDYDKGLQAVWYASPGHSLYLPYWGDKDDFPCWSLSPIKTRHSNAAFRFKPHLPPARCYLPPKEMEPDDLKGGKKN